MPNFKYETKQIKCYLLDRKIARGRWGVMMTYGKDTWCLEEFDEKPSKEIVKLCMRVSERAFDFQDKVLRDQISYSYKCVLDEETV